MRWIIAIVLLALAIAALFFLGLISFHSPPVIDTPADTDPQVQEAEVNEPAPSEAVQDNQPSELTPTEITAVEDWNFPEPDVVLQGEWYHVDTNCTRLTPNPPPTPMLRQVAISAGFKPCFVCSRDDAERDPDEGAGIPPEFRADVLPDESDPEPDPAETLADE